MSSTTLGEDPLQWHNLWDDPAYRARRDELVTDLYDNLPPERADEAGSGSPSLSPAPGGTECGNRPRWWPRPGGGAPQAGGAVSL